MRERRLAVAAIALLVLMTAWERQPEPALAVDAGAIAAAPVARAELDLGMLGTVALSWTIRRLR